MSKAPSPPTSKEFLAWKKKEEQRRRAGKPSEFFKDPETGLTWYLDPKNEAGKPVRFSPKSRETKATENGKNGKHRRAVQQDKTISLEDYIDWAKRNLVPDPIAYATEIFNEAQKKLNETRLNKVPGKDLGHLSPLASPLKGGLEHHRTLAQQDSKINGTNLDRIPSTEAHQQAGIPLTKNGAIRADMRQEPVVPESTRLNIIEADLKNNNRPTARSVKKRLATLQPQLTRLRGGMALTTSPLTPLNQNSAAYGGIERQTNDAVMDMIGVNPATMLKLF